MTVKTGQLYVSASATNKLRSSHRSHVCDKFIHYQAQV